MTSSSSEGAEWQRPSGFEALVAEVRKRPHQADECMEDTVRLMSEIHDLTAEVARLKAEVQRWKDSAAATLLAKLTSVPEDLAGVVAERDEARALARWLYRNGGSDALNAAGAPDMSEWPWLGEKA